MSGTLNKVMLIGHLGDLVKMQYFEEGNSLGRFPLATNETFIQKKTGERITNTEWHSIVVRNKLAEICEKYLSKGDKIYCEGRIKSKQWEQDGITKYATEIHVTEMKFLTTKKDLNKPIEEKNTPKEDNSVLKPSSKKENDLPF